MTELTKLPMPCPHEETLGPWLATEHMAKTLIRLGGWDICCPSSSTFSNDISEAIKLILAIFHI